MSAHPGVSVHMSMNYFSPTPGNQDCEVDSRVTKVGRTLAFAEVRYMSRMGSSAYALTMLSPASMKHMPAAC